MSACRVLPPPPHSPPAPRIPRSSGSEPEAGGGGACRLTVRWRSEFLGITGKDNSASGTFDNQGAKDELASSAGTFPTSPSRLPFDSGSMILAHIMSHMFVWHLLSFPGKVA